MKKPAMKSSSFWRAVSLVSTVGTNIAVCTLLGFYGGGWIGDRFGGGPIWTAFGVLLGIFIGFAGAFLMIRNVLEEPPDE